MFCLSEPPGAWTTSCKQSFLFHLQFCLNVIHYGRAKMYTVVSKCLWKIIAHPDKSIVPQLECCFCRVWIIMTFQLEPQYYNYHLIIIYLSTYSSYLNIPSSDALMAAKMGPGASVLSYSCALRTLTLLFWMEGALQRFLFGPKKDSNYLAYQAFWRVASFGSLTLLLPLSPFAHHSSCSGLPSDRSDWQTHSCAWVLRTFFLRSSQAWFFLSFSFCL